MSDDNATAGQFTTASQKELSPIPFTERLGIMDAIRGFALIAILLMNIEWFNRPMAELGRFDTTLNGADYATSWFVKAFIEGKFYKLFALLFGMGFAVMLIRAQQTQRPFNHMFIKRMAVLFLFGMIHYMFFWAGDILHNYAFSGLILLAWVELVKTNRFKQFSEPGSFLRFGLAIIFLPMVLTIIVATGLGMTKDNQNRTEQWAERQAVVSLSHELLEINTENDVDFELMTKEERIAYKANLIFENRLEREKIAQIEIDAVKGDSFFSSVNYRASDLFKVMMQTLGSGIFMYFPIFLVGYWLIAGGIITNADKYSQQFKVLAWVGTLTGLLITVASLHIIQAPVAIDTTYVIKSAQSLFIFSQFLVAAGYLGILVSIYQIPKWQRRLDHLAPLGRMALTNYLMHSIILSFIFYGYGFGMFGEISRAPQMLMVVAIIIFQLIFSDLWLKYFRFGPLEWLWRCITYNKIQPMRL